MSWDSFPGTVWKADLDDLIDLVREIGQVGSVQIVRITLRTDSVVLAPVIDLSSVEHGATVLGMLCWPGRLLGRNRCGAWRLHHCREIEVVFRVENFAVDDVGWPR